jgi:hypothetical protein
MQTGVESAAHLCDASDAQIFILAPPGAHP